MAFLNKVWVLAAGVLALTLVIAVEDDNWWRKATFYQVYARSFQDSNGDGVGDVRGIIQRAPYFEYLGIDAIWISPIYESPMVDMGYDIQNYTNIDPVFGTIEDFKEMLQVMKSKGIKVILDFVPNHTSDKHVWFEKSEKREGHYTDYYVWRDGKNNDSITPPNNWISVFAGSGWNWSSIRQQFYYHQFLSVQPDLDFRNPLVVQEMKDVIRFWLELGIDGFRVDAVKHVFEDPLFRDEPLSGDANALPDQYNYLNHMYTLSLPEIFPIVKEWRDLFTEFQEKDGFYREEVVIVRLRIGHTCLTYCFLLRAEPCPVCNDCDETITIRHILVDCPVYHLERVRCGLPDDLAQQLGDCSMQLRKILRVMMLESGEPAERTRPYYGNATYPLADLPFNFQIVDAAGPWMNGERVHDLVDKWMRNAVPPTKWSNWQIGNHDHLRIASRTGIEWVDAWNMLNLLLKGTPITYYGEELGMVDTFVTWNETVDPMGKHYGANGYMNYTRDPARTPMQWDNKNFSGFTDGDKTWLPVNPNYRKLNVAVQKLDPRSHLSTYRRLVQLRKTPAIQDGELEYVVVTENVFAFARALRGAPAIAVIINFGPDTEVLELIEQSAIDRFMFPKWAVLEAASKNFQGGELDYYINLGDLSLGPREGIVVSFEPSWAG